MSFDRAVKIQVKPWNAKRWRSIAICSADRAPERIKRYEADYPMASFQVVEIKPKKRRQREYF